MRTVEAFLSVQSPYCYFAMPRLPRLARRSGVDARFRMAGPGVPRIPEACADRSDLEWEYFLEDVERTAAFLGMSHAEADPHPVDFEPDSLWIARSSQPLAWRLMDLSMAADRMGKGLEFHGGAMTLVRDGRTRGWDRGGHLEWVATAVGHGFPFFDRIVVECGDYLRRAFAAKETAPVRAGHRWVPCFVRADAAFHGQDRFDQLLWRLGLSPGDLREVR